METIVTYINEAVYGIGWPIILIVIAVAWFYFKPRY